MPEIHGRTHGKDCSNAMDLLGEMFDVILLIIRWPVNFGQDTL